ncbi:MAG: hypothetical protein HQK83_14990 [Fibrobacteria bacterium]|nr:hypothetical protein [Fibrobacteria bacterium]
MKTIQVLLFLFVFLNVGSLLAQENATEEVPPVVETPSPATEATTPEQPVTNEAAQEQPVATTEDVVADTKEAPEQPKLKDYNLGVGLLFNLDIPAVVTYTPEFYYRTKIRPIGRPIHFTFIPNIGHVRNLEEGKKTHKYEFGWSPFVSVSYPLFFKEKVGRAEVLTGVSSKDKMGGRITEHTYSFKTGNLPTQTAFLIDVGWRQMPIYGSDPEPSDIESNNMLVYGAKYMTTQKGRVDAGEGSYYEVKELRYYFFQLFQPLNFEKPESLPDDRWASMGWKIGFHTSMGGAYGMVLSAGKMPGDEGTSGFQNLAMDIGIYWLIGLYPLPF